jgi:hypothetical protein
VSALVSVNLLGTVEQAAVGPDPYRIDADGAPYVPADDGGVVLGVRLGDGAWQHPSGSWCTAAARSQVTGPA